jgi:hypothetical protein
MATSEMRFSCPCCGYLTLDEPPGSYAICDVCFWEDDAIQLRWPDWTGGANRPSLIEAQRAYLELGAVEPRLLPYVRAVALDEPREAGWRTIDLSIDQFELRGVQRRPWPDDMTVLYWWRTTFWRAGLS